MAQQKELWVAREGRRRLSRDASFRVPLMDHCSLAWPWPWQSFQDKSCSCPLLQASDSAPHVDFFWKWPISQAHSLLHPIPGLCLCQDSGSWAFLRQSFIEEGFAFHHDTEVKSGGAGNRLIRVQILAFSLFFLVYSSIKYIFSDCLPCIKQYTRCQAMNRP